MKVLWFLALLALALVAPVQAQQPEIYHLSPGDKLELILPPLPDLPNLEKIYVVRYDGGFYHPVIGEVRAAGRTMAEVEREIRSRLARELRTPTFRLGLVERSRKDIAVLGDVQKPGKYPLEPGATVLDVLAQAGGLTDKADANQGLIFREGVALPVSLRPPLPGSPSQPATVLRPTDVVFVPSGVRIGVSGEVRTPGLYAIPRQGTTPAEALALAGGAKPEAALTRALLVRSGLPRPLLLDLTPGGILPPEGQVLQDGDSLVVPARQALVAGAITKVVPLRGGENLLDVYAAAGGSTGHIDDIKVIRAQDVAAGVQKAETVDLTRYFEEGDTRPLVPIHDGDVVYIPPQSQGFPTSLFTVLSIVSVIRSLVGF